MVFQEYNHRLGMSDECPFCGKKADRMVWLLFHTETANMGDTYFTGEPKIRVSSKCPECGESSWAHFPMDTLEVLSEMDKPQNL